MKQPSCRHDFVVAVGERKLVWPYCSKCGTIKSTKVQPAAEKAKKINKQPRSKFVVS